MFVYPAWRHTVPRSPPPARTRTSSPPCPQLPIPPTAPPTAETYQLAGVPWFSHYMEQPVVAGSSVLRGLKSIVTLGKEKDEQPVVDNDSIVIDKVVQFRESLAAGQVREGQV